MSFFAQHPYYPQHRRSVVHPTPFASGHGHHDRHGFATSPAAPQFNFYNSGNDYYPSYETSAHAHTPSISIDDEERAAIAHLRSIQRWKEAERIIREEAERERAIAQIQARREAAIAAKVRAHQEREREIALARARIEKERELAIAHRLKEIEAARRAELEDQRRRQQQQRHQRQIAYAAHAARAQQEQLNERRRQCARHCAARRAEQARQDIDQEGDSIDHGLEGLNRLLGSLFGIQIDAASEAQSDKPAAASTVAAEKKEEQAPAAAAAVPEAPAPAPRATEPAPSPKPTEKSASAPSDEKKVEFPEVINDVLANFLGLRVEPESKLGQAVSSNVPAGLNELLGQFGLEFVPDAPNAPKETESGPSEPKASDTTAQPVPAHQPAEASRPRNPFDLSEFLKGDNGLPPFVRDILGNVELAFKNEKEKETEQEVEGKGKGVAEGEKRASSASTGPASTGPASTPASVPAPAPVPSAKYDDDQKSTTSTASMDKLESIASEVRLARDSFTFPSALSFSHNTPTESAPSLLFNKQNKPYHAQNNKLLQLLLQADGVASNGDRDVRRKRKEVVKLVEAELEGLEKKRDEIWRSVKERRENGHESSDDEASSWTTGSTVDHEETVHVEDVAAPAAEQDHAVDTTEVAQPAVNESDAAPHSFTEAAKSAPTNTESKQESEAQPEVEAPVDVASSAEEKKDEGGKAEKEEGYELL